ncbi:uncharacterized protein LOC108739366 [Agrilus planipennis]|uniref:Uncharacterized protein LOC108739366 n=1 Tax=Agrilus planipennis TaxID=224129 RepID=A0A1W4X8L6_AGRPL|nr:uncharacterized protein LOC108739366 [Agrilus planipennis]
MFKASIKSILVLISLRLWLPCDCDIPDFEYVKPNSVDGVVDHYCAPEYNCGYDGQTLNLLCLKQRCKPTRHCGDYFKMIPLSDGERDIITHAHNEIRHDFILTNTDLNELANTTGVNITRKVESLYFYPRLEKFPGKYNESRIKYMNEVSYDKELEFFAQCWANYCLHDGKHANPDNCRRAFQHRDPGQTVFSYTLVTNRIQAVNFTHRKFLDRAIFAWYNEIFEYTDEMFEDVLDNYIYKEGPNTINNFIQLTYPPVNYVGCGRTQYGYGDMITLAIICNYDKRPINNEPPYEFIDDFGETCPGDYDHPNRTIIEERIHCTDGSGAIYYPMSFINCMYRFHAAVRRRVYEYEIYTDESTNYPGLCGRQRQLINDTWKPPFAMVTE